MRGKRTARCESEKNGRMHRQILDEQCCTYRNLLNIFLYLLSMIIIYYNDFKLIYDVYYTSSSISLSYSQNIVSEQYPVAPRGNVYIDAGYGDSSVSNVASAQILGDSQLILLYQTLKL